MTDSPSPERVERVARAAGLTPDGYELLAARMLLIHVTLKLNPAHDALTAVRVLYEEGREAFEKLRGPPCEYAHEWKAPALAADAGALTQARIEGMREAAEIVTAGYQGLAHEERLLLVERATRIHLRAAAISQAAAPEGDPT